MEKYVILLGVSLVEGLLLTLLVGRVVKMWRKVLYSYVKDQDQAIKEYEVQRTAKGMVRIAKQEKMGTKTFKTRTSMRGFKQWMDEHPRQNLTGFFSHNGRDMTDEEIRRVVSYAVENGYETDADIPSEELARILS